MFCVCVCGLISSKEITIYSFYLKVLSCFSFSFVVVYHLGWCRVLSSQINPAEKVLWNIKSKTRSRTLNYRKFKPKNTLKKDFCDKIENVNWNDPGEMMMETCCNLVLSVPVWWRLISRLWAFRLVARLLTLAWAVCIL